ncbi:MAG TPA: c-type cytochrome [Burkholderiales bacterium]|nr:c-type cytochrome [Burkholderiales bacterium]
MTLLPRAAALVALVCASILPLAAQQDAPSKTLLPGPGAALTMAKCSLCHDITHVTRSKLTRDEWDDNIKVMIARGMPIRPDEIAVVLEYLSTYYNRDKPPPAAAAAAAAEDTPPVRHGCVACHALDNRVIGPSFREIAARYRGDAGAATRLAAKVKDGGAGAWGAVPMPAHPQLAAADIESLVAWVLQQ